MNKPDPYPLLIEFLKKRNLALDHYHEYLSLLSERPYDQLTQQLQEKKIDLLQYENFLSSKRNTEPALNDPSDPTRLKEVERNLIEAFACHFLAEKRILLEELNRILQEIPQLNWNHFLLQIFRQKKMTLDEFIAYRQNKIALPPPKDYRFKMGKFPCFYREVEESQKRYGSYVLLEELGKGGMGIVYKAYHPSLNQFAALKLLLNKNKASEKGKSRFLREVQIMAKLKHENIVQIYDSGEEAEQIYLAMEYVNGKPLEHQKNELSLREKLQVIEKALEGLFYAHEHKIIHRDLKLENILLTTELVPKLADFGLAKELNPEQEKLTETGVLLGTLPYMAPEQANGNQNEIDEQTDVYAMGVCLYRLLTQKFPFEGKTLNALLRQIVTQEPLPPSNHQKEIHPDIDYIVLKALEKEKPERYKNARAFQRDIHCILEGLPLEGRETKKFERIQKWIKRHPKELFFGSVLLSVFVSFLVIGYLAKTRDKEQAFQNHYTSAKHYQSLAKNNTAEATLYLLKTFNELKEALQKRYQTKVEQEQWELGKELILHQIKTNQEQNLVSYLFQEVAQFKSISEHEKNELRATWKKAKEAQGQRERKRFAYWIKKLKEQDRQKNETEWNDALYEIVKMSDPQIFQELAHLIEEGYETVWRQEKEAVSDYHEWLIEIAGRMENQTLVQILIQVLTQGNNTISYEPEKQLPFYKKKYLFCLLRALGNLKISAKEYEELYYQIFVNLVNEPSFQKRLFRLYKNLFSATNLELPVEENAENYFSRANKKVLIQDYEGALSDYTQAIRLNPQYHVAYNSRGILKESMGDCQGALQDYTEAIRLDSQNATPYNNRGNIKRLQGDWNGALQDYTEALRLNPQNAETYNQRGLLRESKGEIDEALQDYTEALRLNPQDANAYHNRGNTKRTRGDLEGAIADYTVAIRLNPKEAGVYNNRGDTKQSKGDLEGAIADYTAAIRLNPKEAGVYYNRGNAKQIKDDLEGAIRDFTETIALNPQYTMAYLNRGDLKKIKGDLEGAIQDYTEAIRLDPQLPNSYYNRGNMKQARGDFDGAIADYNESIRLKFQSFEVYTNRGLARQAKGDLKGAMEDYTEALRLNPANPETYFNRGNAHVALGNFDEALQDYNESLRFRSHPEVYNNRGHLKQLKGDLAGALLDFTESIRLNPQDVNAYLNRGGVYFRKGNLKESKEDYRRFLELTKHFTDRETQKTKQQILQLFPELAK